MYSTSFKYLCSSNSDKDMRPTTVFISYNPGNDFEQTLAVRLHTIGAVHGFNMLMPDRFSAPGQMNNETAYRIKSSDYFILFSTSPLTNIVQQEINTAFAQLNDKSKIIIIYNKVKNLKHNANCTEVFIDASKDSPQVILDKVIQQIQKSQAGIKNAPVKKGEDPATVLGGILLIGLGLLALDSLFNGKK
ncbi:hypothetical protein ACFS6H_00195 [Terrimonas rubra]|uniref:TIR domain-containing protein n=1 Tax=Terrimonas rubra TaxID=1035890 RepID=A0ABW6A010_9BACT